MKNLLKLHIKFILAMLMTLTMLVMLPACSSTSGGSAETADTPEEADCVSQCAGDPQCIDKCYTNM